MRITGLDVLRVDRFVCVRIDTDEGLSGFGESHPASGTAGNPRAVLGAIEECRDFVLGRDPERIEELWQHLFHRQVFRGGADPMSALSAVDTALWDLNARAQGRPVHALLGGAVRDRVRLYAHVRGDRPEAVAEAAATAAAAGFTTVRLYPFGPFDRALPTSVLALASLAAENVEAVRLAVGPDVDIIIDAVCRLSPPEALEVARATAPYGLLFFEDPIAPDEPAATSRFAARSPVPVGAGERLLTIFDFQRLLADGSIAYIRPDPSLVGGITGFRKIAALAEATDVAVVPHNPLSPLLTATCVQLAAATSGVNIVEYAADPPAEIAAAFPGAQLPSRGHFAVENRPGLGVTVVDTQRPPVPYARSPLLNDDGSLRDY